MSRNSTAAVTSASQLAQLRYRVLCHVDSLLGGPVRACTGGNFIVCGATTYTPVGGFGGLDDPVSENTDVFPTAVRLWFAAVNTAQVVDLVNENFFNRPVKLYRAFLDDNLTVVGTPDLLSSLRINKSTMKTNDPQRGNYFELECESRLRRNPRAQYYDRATLQQIFGSSGDTFFNFTYKIATTRAQWGLMLNYPLPGDYVGDPFVPAPTFGNG